jgi:hypothetical protein
MPRLSSPLFAQPIFFVDAGERRLAVCNIVGKPMRGFVRGMKSGGR